MENFLSDQSKFYKIPLKDNNFLNFITSQEKCTDKIYKKFVDSNSISEETRRHLKLERTRPEIMYGYCKKNKKCVDGSPPFRLYLSALQTPTYKFAKYLVPILEPLTNNKYPAKDSFNFATEIFEQYSSYFVRSLAINSRFTNILPEETIEICTNNRFKNSDHIHGL